uniref:protein O-GlcNAcase n=1 Tax=Petromyzon marinus TaxID=7757 RepID=A0AAJ7SZE9_PETMA|nr:protein O-GlcNAcase isoform X1 [Petromyzon marinus]
MVQQEGDPPHEAHGPPMAQGGAAHGGGVGGGSKRKFSCGVVEGFYGRPWTMEQRKNLFKRMQRWGLNTYMYAPKDDSKHRMFWREMYSVEEADQLMSLIAAAREHDVEFVYAISPGLDMSFSNPKEVVTLKRKLEQVSQFGCRGFALLFDDIDQNMCPADKEVFTSFAYAQVSVTNEVYQHLGEPASFMFCPTEYCGSLCYPNPAQSPYLQTVGEKLLPNIDVLWTGPKVVSKDISLESVEEVSKVLKRRPVIWDNIHANDYDQKRLFLGPFKGRSSELIPRLNGLLTNPNCEFEANFVAVHTLATWYHSNMHGVRKDAVMAGSEDSTVSVQIKLENEGSDEELETDVLYSPRTALKLALVEWLHDFAAQQPRRQVTGSGPKTSLSNVITVSLPAASMATVSTSIYQQPIMSSSSTTLPASPDSTIDPKPHLGVDEEVEEEGGDLVKGGDDVDDGGGSGGAVDDSAGAKTVVEEPMETAACEKPDCGDTVTASEPRPMDTDLDGAAGGPVATDGGPGGTVEVSGGTEEGPGGTAPATPPDREMSPIDTEREGVVEGSPTHGVSEGVSEEVGTPAFLRGNIDAVVVEEEEDGRSMQAEAWPMQTDDVIPCGGAGTAAGSGGKSSAVDPVTADDLDLLADLFYLPYEHGPRAAQLLREFHWLKVNSSAVGCSRSVAEPNKEREEDWRARALAFEELCNRVTQMFTRLSSIANRSVLYDLYPYIWDIKGIVSMVKSFVKWLGCRSQTHSQFLSGDQEPWVFRGGLAGELQRMLPIDGANDLFFQPPPLPPTAKVYTIRPYLPQDEAAAYKVCRETYADGLDGTQLFPDNPDLIGDRLVGSLLSLSPEYCFVLEDEEGVCGYALGSVDAKSFFSRCEVAWLPAMQDKYTRPAATGDDALSLSLEVMLSFHEEARVPPETLVSRFPSLVRVDIHSRVTDPSVAKSMMGCLLSSLKANGSQGAFCEVKASDKGNTEFYTKLGFFEVPMAEGFCKDAVLLGRPI